MGKVVLTETNFKTVAHERDSRPINIGRIDEELRPEELHLIPDGAVGDQPSFCFVLIAADGRRVLAQISDAMLRRGLAALEPFKIRAVPAPSETI